MYEPLIKFPADSTVAGQREVLARRISSLEKNRQDHEEEVERLRRIAKSWEGKLRRAESHSWHMEEEIKRGTEQLLRLLPGVQSDNILPGLYTFQGGDLWGTVSFRKEVQPKGEPGQPMPMHDDITVLRDQARGSQLKGVTDDHG